MDLYVLAIHDVYQVWTIILIVDVFTTIQEQYHPPMVTSTIDFTSTADFDICAIDDLNEIQVSLGTSLSRPELYIL
jgi:hypothetical protein